MLSSSYQYCDNLLPFKFHKSANQYLQENKACHRFCLILILCFKIKQQYMNKIGSSYAFLLPTYCC